MDTLLDFLDTHHLPYRLFHHPPVFTVADSRRLKGRLPGASTKNLFLTTKKHSQFFLYSLPADKRADLQQLAIYLSVPRLSFASPQHLWQYLKLKPGSVSPFGLLNDTHHQVTYILDSQLAQASYLGFHPNTNTATLVMATRDFFHFLKLLNITPFIFPNHSIPSN